MKHTLYGFTVEASVPNGIAISESNHYSDSASEIQIMRDILQFTNDALSRENGRGVGNHLYRAIVSIVSQSTENAFGQRVRMYRIGST